MSDLEGSQPNPKPHEPDLGNEEVARPNAISLLMATAEQKLIDISEGDETRSLATLSIRISRDEEITLFVSRSDYGARSDGTVLYVSRTQMKKPGSPGSKTGDKKEFIVTHVDDGELRIDGYVPDMGELERNYQKTKPKKDTDDDAEVPKYGRIDTKLSAQQRAENLENEKNEVRRIERESGFSVVYQSEVSELMSMIQNARDIHSKPAKQPEKFATNTEAAIHLGKRAIKGLFNLIFDIKPEPREQ